MENLWKSLWRSLNPGPNVLTQPRAQEARGHKTHNWPRAWKRVRALFYSAFGISKTRIAKWDDDDVARITTRMNTLLSLITGTGRTEVNKLQVIWGGAIREE